jgi:NAD(P)-dependent dehydrogenase (short-subunit alcohol dehydrogenase family)
MNDTPWTQADIPPQNARLAIVTGTGGLGYETALALAQAGARVILAGRNEIKGRESVEKILALHPKANIAFEKLDLASLASVADFASRFARTYSSLDLLVNNAGVMTPPQRQTTADGFELQFGTNYLGHFALTAHLLPRLREGHQPRVVNVSSGAHRLRAAIHFDDLQWEKKYQPWPAYAQSKLANLLFTLELQRRSDANGWGLMVNAAHPGYARTELIPNGPGAKGFGWFINKNFMQPWISHSPAEGALPTLFAATSPAAEDGGYYGPTKLFEMKGPPGRAVIGKKAKDMVVAERLWEVSGQLSGVRWPFLRKIPSDVTNIG